MNVVFFHHFLNWVYFCTFLAQIISFLVTEFFLLLLFIRQVIAGNEVHFADHLMQSLFYNFITFIIAHLKLDGKVVASQ